MGKFPFLWWWWREGIVILWSQSFPCVWILNVPAVCRMYIWEKKGKKRENNFSFFRFCLLWFGYGAVVRWFCRTEVVFELCACRVVIGWEGPMLVNVSFRATGLWERLSVHDRRVLLPLVFVTALLLLLLNWYSHLLLLLGHPCIVSVIIFILFISYNITNKFSK